MDTVWLVARVIVSLAIVLGLIWALARVKKRVSPKGAGALQILSKTPVSKRGSLLLVEVAGRTLLIGSTDTAISLLTEVRLDETTDEPRQERTAVDVDSLIEEWRAPMPSSSVVTEAQVAAMAPQQPEPGPLAGSVLSPQTWQQFTQALREKTVRS